MRKMIFSLFILLFWVSGCATLRDFSKDVCDLAIGGSRMGVLCEKIYKLGADEEAVSEEAPAEVTPPAEVVPPTETVES